MSNKGGGQPLSLAPQRQRLLGFYAERTYFPQCVLSVYQLFEWWVDSIL